MKHITFERIILCVIAAGVWTIAGLYIYEFINNKHVEVVNTVSTHVVVDNISILYQKAYNKGILKKGLTEEQFREQILTDEGLLSFYNYATTHGMKLSPWAEFRKKVRQ